MSVFAKHERHREGNDGHAFLSDQVREVFGTVVEWSHKPRILPRRVNDDSRVERRLREVVRGCGNGWSTDIAACKEV